MFIGFNCSKIIKFKSKNLTMQIMDMHLSDMLSSVTRSVYGFAFRFLISSGVNFRFVLIWHLHLLISR